VVQRGPVRIGSRVLASLGALSLLLGLFSGVTSIVFPPSIASASQVPWTPSQAPLPGAPLPDGGTAQAMDLSSTSCSSSSFCVAVGWVSDGSESNGYIPRFPFAEMYLGGLWTPAVLPRPSDAESFLSNLTSVACASDDSCAAVGTYSSGSNNLLFQSGLLEQLSVGVWTASAAPLPGGPDSALVDLNSVTCSEPVTCVGVGVIEDNVSGAQSGVIYTLNSGGWQLQLAPIPSDSNGVNMTGVSCPDHGDCVAVGYYQDRTFIWHGLIFTFASGIWTDAVTPTPVNLATGAQARSPNLAITAVDCPDIGSCVAGGFYADTNGNTQPLVLQQQSGSWTPLEGPVPSDSQINTLAGINGMYCAAVGACVATGFYWTNFDQPGGESGLILTESNGAWTAASAPLPSGPSGSLPTVTGARTAGLAVSFASASLAGVACSVDGFCAAAGAEGHNGLVEAGTFSGLPSVTALSPTQGSVAGGTTVTVSGTNFGADSIADFGGIAVPTTVVSPTELQATAPPLSAAQPVDVTVTTGGFRSRAHVGDRYSYFGVLQRVAGYSRPGTAISRQSAKVTLVVPTISCKGVPTEWGTQSVNEGVRFDTPKGATIGGVTLACAGPKATYAALIEINGATRTSTINVSPASTITVVISESGTKTAVTVTDASQIQSATGPGTTVTGEEIGAISANCSVSNCSSVPRLTVTKFTAANLDGENPTAAGAAAVNLEDAGGHLEIAAARTGAAAFKTTWDSSCGTTTSC
jgi:hypothetical protein